MDEMIINPQYLTSLVGQALGEPSVQLGEWGIERLKGGLEFGSNIFRLAGMAEIGGNEQRWSLILKTILPEAEFDDPTSYRYWKRETLAFQSGLLYDLPGQVTAPRCYDVRENPDGSIWICMEEVKDEQEIPWSIERYAQVARHLGEFNGAYLVDCPLPTETWLTHDWLRKYVEHAAPMIEFIRQNPAHLIVQQMLPGISLPLTLAFWDEHPHMLKALDGLPQTFCHQDAFRRNLFYRAGQLIAIDWSFAGLAPVGAELAALIGAAFGLGNFPSSQAKELDQACFEGYLEGLRQAGWQPDPRQIRLGYSVTVVLRYVLGATVGELLPGLLNQATREHWAEGLGVTEEKAAESDAGIVAYYTSVSLEALKLLGLGSLLRVVAHVPSHALRLGRKRSARPARNG